MKRISRALVCAAAIVFVIGLVFPSGAAWAQKGSKRPAPANAQASGKAVDRDGGQPSEHGKGRAAERKGRDTDQAAVRHVDGRDAHGVVRVEDRWWDRDRNYVVVHEYYGRHGLPPGLAKKHKLPPGLRKQLRERGHLPPGLEKHWVVLPFEMERTLPPLPPHYVRRVVDDDLIVVDIRTNFVVSIMAGVFIRG